MGPGHVPPTPRAPSPQLCPPDATDTGLLSEEHAEPVGPATPVAIVPVPWAPSCHICKCSCLLRQGHSWPLFSDGDTCSGRSPSGQWKNWP